MLDESNSCNETGTFEKVEHSSQSEVPRGNGRYIEAAHNINANAEVDSQNEAKVDRTDISESPKQQLTGEEKERYVEAADNINANTNAENDEVKSVSVKRFRGEKGWITVQNTKDYLDKVQSGEIHDTLKNDKGEVIAEANCNEYLEFKKGEYKIAENGKFIGPHEHYKNGVVSYEQGAKISAEKLGVEINPNDPILASNCLVNSTDYKEGKLVPAHADEKDFYVREKKTVETDPEKWPVKDQKWAAEKEEKT